MKTNDASLTEVWEWKDKVYQDIKGLSLKERLEKIKKDAEKILMDNHIKLKAVTLRKEHQRTA